MPASTLTRNSTNVRNAVNLAWHRRSLAVTSALAPARAVETAARLFSTPPRFDGHRLILREATVVRDAVDFLAGEVEFAPPAPRGAVAFGAPAPIL